MNELDRLTALLDETATRAVRLGYALGYRHGEDYGGDCDLGKDAPEFRALEQLGYLK